jgi:hypothetical protein
MRNNTMKPLKPKDVIVFALLLVVGIAGRFACLDIPNFQPTMAVALFAGFYFAQRRTAFLVPLAVMAVSNLWLDSYMTWGEMIVVYAAFLWPVLLGRHLLQDQQAAARPAIRCGICVTAPSLVFFLATNFGVWLFNGMYPHTLGGLTQCYCLAIPFYGYSLAGDLVFVPLLFGAHHLCLAGGLMRWPSGVTTA